MSFAAIGIGLTAVSVGYGMYSAASAPGMPGAPDLAAASREASQANADVLPDQRRLAAAAQQGGTATYTAHGHKEKQNQVQVRDLSKPNNYASRTWVPYVESEWQPGGKYADATKYQARGRRTANVTVPESTQTADFTGAGAADVQGKLADQYAGVIGKLGDKYGVQFAEEARRQLQESDPQGFAAREKMYQLIQQQIEEKPDRPVADLLDKQIGEQLSAGSGLDSMSRDVLDSAVARASADRGQAVSGDFERPLTTGLEGEARNQAAIQRASGWLSSGSTPEDIAYRREQQNMANLGAFTSGQTPTSQFRNLSSAQQGTTPFNPGQSLPNMGNGDQGANQFAIGNWNTALEQASSTANPWMSALSLALKGAGAAGAAGFQPLASKSTT